MKLIKSIGVVAIAALALAAISASAATAAEFTTDAESKESNMVHGNHLTNTEVLTSGFATMCGDNDFVGAPLDVSTGILTPAAFTLGECVNSNATLNGCTLNFRAGIETSPGKSTGSMDIGPPGCGPIEFESTFINCKVEFGPQTGRGAVYYETKESGGYRHVEINAEVVNLAYTQSGGVICPNKTGNDGKYSATWKAVAEDPVNSQAGLFIAPSPQAHKPRLEASGYPMPISGGQSTSHQFGVKVGDASCNSAGLSSEVTGHATELALAASYDECLTDVLGEPRSTQVSMNSCRYVVDLLPVGPPYEGTVEIECTQAGDTIEVLVKGANDCKIKIGPQQVEGSVDYENAHGSVIGTVDLTGIAYVQEGFFCPGNNFNKERSFTDGTYTGSSQVGASNGAIAITGEG